MKWLLFRASHLVHFANFSAAQPLFCAPGGPGSRYVPPGGPAALYLALDEPTADREFNKHYYDGFGTTAGRLQITNGVLRPLPFVSLGVHVDVSRLLDLENSAPSRSALGIKKAELLGPWAGIANPTTQILGQEIFDDNFFEGIVYPSAQHSGHSCLILFRDRLLTTSRIHFHDATTGITGQLP